MKKTPQAPVKQPNPCEVKPTPYNAAKLTDYSNKEL